MKFKISQAFEINDDISTWVINLAIIRNDLKNALKYVMEYFTSESRKQDDIEYNRLMYHYKILIVHYREALKYLINSRKIAMKYFDMIPNNQSEIYRSKYSLLISAGEPYEKSFLKEICVPLRNVAIHYSENEKKIDEVLTIINVDREADIIQTGTLWSDINYDFADDIINNILFGDLEPVKFNDDFSMYVRDMIVLIDEIIQEYLKQKKVI